MSTHRYQRRAIYLDYGRAGLGLCVTGGPLLFLDVAPALGWPFGFLGLLFAWFGVRTGVRHASRVELTPERIALSGPRPRAIAWQQLREVRLAYFSPRRSRAEGWLQLTLRGPGRHALKVDSTLERFDDLLVRVQDAAAANRLPLEPVTAANFAALGLGEAAPAEPDQDGGAGPPLPIPQPGTRPL